MPYLFQQLEVNSEIIIIKLNSLRLSLVIFVVVVKMHAFYGDDEERRVENVVYKSKKYLYIYFRMEFTLHLITTFFSVMILVSVSGKVSRRKRKVSFLKIYNKK